MKIGKREIKEGSPTYIIFEVASTHSNDFEIARAYVKKASDVGADAIKFQLFTADGIMNPLTTGLKGTYDYFKTAETPREWFPKIKALCDIRGIDLLCTPFDIEGASFLDDVGLPAVKVASGELTNHQLLEHVAGFGKPIILATGMATMEEVTSAVSILRKNGAEDIILLQCVSVYPTSFEDANVSAMLSLQKEFGTLVGYSDNGSAGDLVPRMAVAMGGVVIEKHVTSKKERGNLDDKFSLSVEQFGDMVRNIRKIDALTDRTTALEGLKREFGDDFEKAYGDGIKRPAPHGTVVTHPGMDKPFVMKEADERLWARRGVYLKEPVEKGTIIEKDMITLLRPDIGISGVQYEDVIGKVAVEDLSAKHPLKFADDGIVQFHLSDADILYPGPDFEQFRTTLKDTALFK